jgi:hypothetical protein
MLASYLYFFDPALIDESRHSLVFAGIIHRIALCEVRYFLTQGHSSTAPPVQQIEEEVEVEEVTLTLPVPKKKPQVQEVTLAMPV